MICDKCLVTTHKEHETEDIGLLSSDTFQNWLEVSYISIQSEISNNLEDFHNVIKSKENHVKEIFERELHKLNSIETKFNRIVEETFKSLRTIVDFRRQSMMDHLKNSINNYEGLKHEISMSNSYFI